MASRYDDLDPSTQLEQRFAVDLKAALEPRGCVIVHHGTNAGGRHSPGGYPDLEVRDKSNHRLILVEVTKRKGSQADGEFLAVTHHLNQAISEGGYQDYCLLYISPCTSARMSTNFRDLYNRTRERERLAGRIIATDFAGAELLLDKLSHSDPNLYPANRLGNLFAHWEEALDDARTRQLIQTTLFPEDLVLAIELEKEAQALDADREKELKRQLEQVENEFRSSGITGNAANTTLIYLAFLRLYEERRQRRTALPNRFTLDGFRRWKESLPARVRREAGDRTVEVLLLEEAEDAELKVAGLLQESGDRLPRRLSDGLVEKLILPLFDKYDFHAGRVDVLGAVFETLARRGEKDTRIGQFFTPQQVVDFCAEIVNLRPTDVVIDPAVGTGRFLIAAMDRMLDNADSTLQPQERVEESIRQQQLMGADIDGWVATIAKMNMFIHGDGKSGIAEVNGLVLADTGVFPAFPHGLANAIDVVLTNPPLGETDFTVAASVWEELAPTGSSWDRSDFYRGLGVVPLRALEEEKLRKCLAKRAILDEMIGELEMAKPAERPEGKLRNAYRRRNTLDKEIAKLHETVERGAVTVEPVGKGMKGGALFLGALAQCLKRERYADLGIEGAGGRAAVIVDEAVLNTPEYGAVRSFIRQHFYVKAVISLARDAFQYLAHTDAKTSILYLIRKPHDGVVQREPVFFSHADRVGYSATGTWIGDDLPQILLHYQVFETAVRRSYRGPHFRPLDCEKSVRKLPGFGDSFYARFDDGEGAGRLDYYHARLLERESELKLRFGEAVKLGDVLEVRKLFNPPPSRTGEYEFAYVSRHDGTVRPKGVAAVSYRPAALWVVQEGDIVVSGIDAVNGAIGIARADVDGMVMSKEMFAYRVRFDCDASPEYIQMLLRSSASLQMIMGFATGTSNRTRLESPEQLLELHLPPLPSLSEQEEPAAALREAYRMAREAETTLVRLSEQVEEAWGQPARRQHLDPLRLPAAEAQLIR